MFKFLSYSQFNVNIKDYLINNFSVPINTQLNKASFKLGSFHVLIFHFWLSDYFVKFVYIYLLHVFSFDHDHQSASCYIKWGNNIENCDFHWNV